MSVGRAQARPTITMELLEAHQLTRYQRGEPLFQPLDLRLRRGTRLGVVGPNGSGKSTLLGLLAGTASPDEGRVLRPPGVRYAYLPQAPAPTGAESVWQAASGGLQAVREAEARLREEERRLARGEPREDALAEALATFEIAGGYVAEADLREVLAALGFGPEGHDRPVSRLSGGERRRLALAAVLAGAPDVILLDEPTNHLDLDARAWLGERLARWPGAVVLVSHDRALLDRATNVTLFLGSGAPELRRGGYERARQAREHTLHALRRRDAEREREARRLRAMSSALARRGNRGAARRRRAADRRAASLATLEADVGPSQPAAGVRLALDTRGLQGVLLEGHAIERAGVLSLPDVRLVTGQRVALVGPNGSGKSTLLGLLAGTLPSDDPRGELRYAAGVRLAAVTQLARGLEPGESVLRQLEAVATPARARRLLAEAGVPASLWERAPEHLSGGERARAGLALLEARDADLLLLDEPTNDLDLPAIEALERALCATAAGVVVATHDHRLAERVANEVWTLEGGRLLRYPDIAAYRSGHAFPPRPAPGAGEAEAGGARGAAPPAAARDAAPIPGGSTEAPAAAGPDPGARRLEALEDEARRVERLLEDPLTLAPRELERLQSRRAALLEALALAYEARSEPPSPRFRVRERGLAVVADRHGGDLLVMAVSDTDAARAMQALLRVEDGGADADDESVLRAWPWARVTAQGTVGHVALTEPRDACLLPWARTALADGAARHAFTLLEVSALQLFCREPLPGTRLQDGGAGWWTWTRAGFARAEGLPDEPAPDRRPEGRRRRGGRPRGPGRS